MKPLNDLTVIRLWHKLSNEFEGEFLAILFAQEIEKLHGIRVVE